MDKILAQKRADRVKAFREELAILERDGILSLTENNHKSINEYHQRTLDELSQQYDIDTTNEQKRLSWGMRIASLLGALAISAALFFFFYRFWNIFSTPIQVFILIAVPVLAAIGVELAAQREKTLYFSSILALLAFTAFVLDLSALGSLFNITPSQNAFLAWAAFGFIFAYTYRLKLLLVAAMTSLMAYLAALIGVWSGLYWLYLGERPENFIFAGLVLFAMSFIRQDRFTGFTAIYRVYGLLAIFAAILVLANWGSISYLPLANGTIENFYQALGFIIAGIFIYLGIRMKWSGVANLAITFFVIFLYTKLFGWWWNWMPKYVFFLIIGVIAMSLLWLLKKLRAMPLGQKT